MNTFSRWLTALFGAASTLVAMFALFPSVAAADIGPFQITGGNLSDGGTVSGNGFTGSIAGGPELLSAPYSTYFGGVVPLDVCFGCGLPGTDDGVGSLSITGLTDPALAGLVQVFGEEGPLQTGELTVSPTIDVTGPGIYIAPFTLAVTLDYGPPGSTTAAQATQYVDIVGSGTVTLDVAANPSPDADGRLETESLNYSFAPAPPAAAPELDPGSAASGLTLLLGGLLVLRGRGKQPVAG